MTETVAEAATPAAPEATLESVACDLCGGEHAATLVIKNGFRVVRCTDCGLVFVNPRPRASTLSALYDTGSYQHHQVTRAGDAAWRKPALARLRLVNEKRPEKGALLDVGCSTGWFLQVASEAGWKVTGMDVSAGSVAHVRGRGFDVRLATLESHDLPPRSFDVITMFDSIEHMPSPRAALAAVHELLVDGGLLVVTTPNVEGLFPRLTYQMLGRTFGAWMHPEPPGHVYQFGKSTLASTLERAGFAVVEEQTEAIALDHTVGELEDSLMDVLAGRVRRPAATDARRQSAPPRVVAPAPGAESGDGSASGPAKPRPLRRALRLGVWAWAWALTHSVAAPAPWLGKGDSLVVVARKVKKFRA